MPFSIPIEPPSAQSPLETRSIILLCAARLLRENGYAAVSLRQIANEAGIRASTIYYHFESKEEILFHVLEEGLRVIVHEVNKGVATMPAGLSFHERLRIVVRSHLHGLLQVGDFSFGKYPHLRAGSRGRDCGMPSHMSPMANGRPNS